MYSKSYQNMINIVIYQKIIYIYEILSISFFNKRWIKRNFSTNIFYWNHSSMFGKHVTLNLCMRMATGIILQITIEIILYLQLSFSLLEIILTLNLKPLSSRESLSKTRLLPSCNRSIKHPTTFNSLKI